MNNIVFITDENYIIPTKTAINSVIRNAAADIVINVIAVDVSEKSRESILSLQNEKIKINVFSLDNHFSDVGLNHVYVSKAALYKFELPNIFSDLDNILYADGDMIFYPGFEKIFDYDISDYYAAVVQDMIASVIEGWPEKIGNEKYFNSGIMYINLKKWREDSISKKLIAYKKNDLEDHFMDQNALNKIIGKNVLWISPAFNHMTTCSINTFEKFYQDRKALIHIAQFYDLSPQEMNGIIQHPKILHVTGEKKVWKNFYSDRFDEWITYALPEDYLRIIENNYQLVPDKYYNMNEEDLFITFLEKKHNYSYTLGTEISFKIGGNARTYMLSGFSDCESWGCWTDSIIAQMKLDISQIKADLVLEMEYIVFDKQHVLFFVNGDLVEEFEAKNGNRKIIIPQNILKDNIVMLKFEIPMAKSPKECGISDDNRTLGLGFKTMTIRTRINNNKT